MTTYTDDLSLVDVAAGHFNAVWSGEHCKNCKRKDFCGMPITKQVKSSPNRVAPQLKKHLRICEDVFFVVLTRNGSLTQ